MTDGEKKYALAYAAKLEALRVRDFSRVQSEEAYMRKIASGYGLSFADTRRIKDQVEGKKTMSANPAGKTYYTVVIPYAPPGRATEWHPTEKTGEFSTLTRGAFKTKAEAHAWAKKHLNDTPYSVYRKDMSSNPNGEVSAAPTGGSGAGLLAIGVLALVGGVIYVATRPDAPGGSATGGGGGGTLPTPPKAPPSQPKCLDCAPSPTGDETEAESFAKASGYNVWCVENKPVATWQPAKSEYTSDPKARAYSQADCSFYKWTGASWVKDEGTNTDLKNWRAQFVTSGHPVSAFVIGA